MNCNGFGQLTPDSAASTPMQRTRTITETETPILREPNGRRARDLFSNASLEGQITWVKGRLSDVYDPILSIGQRQAARLNLGHCLEKDREHKLPSDLRSEAARVASEPLPRLRRLKST